MWLITVNYDKLCVAAVENPDAIQKPEDVFGEPVRLHCEGNCIPKIMPARREPVARREKVKVDGMCITGVLAKVEKTYSLVSQMVETGKKSGDLRICLDPRPFNDVLKRD